MTTYNYLKGRELAVRSIAKYSFGDFSLRCDETKTWADWEQGMEYTANWLQIYYMTDGEQV